MGRVIPTLVSPSQFTDFLTVVKLIYKSGGVLDSNYIREKDLDPLKYGTSFLLYEVTSNLIKNYRTDIWQTELVELSTTDPNALFYLVDIYIYTDKIREALTMLAKTLIKYPMMVHLLFK